MTTFVPIILVLPFQDQKLIIRISCIYQYRIYPKTYRILMKKYHKKDSMALTKELNLEK